MPIFKVRKRNGSMTSFDRLRIVYAITAAAHVVGSLDASEIWSIADDAIGKIEASGVSIPDVEAIQDAVESSLIHHGHDAVAKAYILYRARHAELRASKATTVEVEQTISEYLGKTDWRVHENANSGYSLGGLILNTSGKVTANYWLSHVYTQEAGNAHRNADIHIHDLDMFSGYCAGWSLRALLEEWLGGLTNRTESAPPKNLQSAVNQMVNFFGTLQNEWAGAQAFSSFDTYLSPFVHKYRMELEAEITEHGMTFPSVLEQEHYLDEKTYRYVLQNMQNFVFGLNMPSRWGTQTPFTNITLDWTCPTDLKSQRLHIGGYDATPYIKTFGELDRERQLINRALIEVYLAGDAKGRVFTFPIPTYNITEDFPWDDPDTERIFDMTAKYGIPYFQNFIGSQYITRPDEHGIPQRVRNPNAYEPGAVRSMCCRLQLDLRELLKRGNGLFGSAEMTGSIGVVTLNMARIGFMHAGNKDAFKKQVRYLMDLARDTLETKRQTATMWLERGLYPYTARYLRSFRNHFATIGLNGMNEAIRNFTADRENIATPAGKAFALEMLDYMRDILREYQESTGNLYNLEATPAEGTTYRFAREDRKQLTGIIQAGTEEAPYYTNSTQLPVWYTDDMFEALEAQNELQCRYTGGTVLHLYLGERVSSARACRELVRRALTQYQLPYITVTPTFSICPKHGYIAGEHDYCPHCDAESGYSWSKHDIPLRTRYTDDQAKLEHMANQTVSA